MALALVACAPAGATVVAPVPVDTILAAYGHAIGNITATSIETAGTQRGEGLNGDFHTWRDGNRERDEERLGPRTETTLRVGNRMWVRNGNGNVRELRGFLYRRALTADFVDSGAFLHEPARARFVGTGTVGNRNAWRIEVNALGGEPETLWIDTQTGLLLRTEYLDGDGPTYVDLSDWRTVGGGRMAFHSVTSDGVRAFDVETQTTSVTLGVTIDPARFAPLADRALRADGVQELPLVALAGGVGCAVTIAGTSYTFLIDSGSQSVLLDSRIAKAAGLGELGDLEVRGAGRTGGLHVAELPALQIGNATLDNLVVSTIDLLGGGLRADGILGYPFFAAGLVQLDFPHNIVRFGPRGSFVPPGEPIALDVDRELPEATVRINGRVDAPFIIDTGDASAVLLYQPFADAHPGLVPTSGDASVTMGGLGGSNPTDRVTLDSLALGSIVFAPQPAELIRAKFGAFADRIQGGNIGLGLLRKFVVTFDLGNDTLYLYRPPTTPQPATTL